MMLRPRTLDDLIGRIAPAALDDVYNLAPIVATAAEAGAASSTQRRFWVVVHSVTDRGLKLLHARPIRANCILLRIEAEGGEVVQTMLVVSGSHPNGQLYETEAQFQHARLDVASVPTL